MRRLARNLLARLATHAAASSSGRSSTAATGRCGPHGVFSLRTAWTDSRGYEHFGNRGSGPWLRGRAPWVAGAGVVAFGAYYLSCLETVPYSNRRHSLMFVSRQQEQAMGRMVFEMQREEAKQQHRLLPEQHPLSRLVRTVGLRIAGVASSDLGVPGSTQHMKGLDWQFAVIQSPVPNAFVVPGGKVVVFTGLLDLLSSQDELAAVLAHETSHVLARHHAERMSTMNLFAIGRLIMYALFGFSVPQAVLLLGIFLPYSRRAELEADALGLRLMALACYDPAACPSMLAKLAAKEDQQHRGAKVPVFLSTHPLTTERVDLVRKQLPEAYTLYSQQCGTLRGVFDSGVLAGAFP